MDTLRLLGIDYGRKRVGVALSDPTGQIARPLETLTVTSNADAVRRIIILVAEHEVTAVVVGLPLSMSGNESESTTATRQFARMLGEATALPIYFEDERLSSHQALEVLHAHGKKIKGNKDKLDRMSAAIILQSFLDRRGYLPPRPDGAHE
jgi:putative Holliday junction resolvase